MLGLSCSHHGEKKEPAASLKGQAWWKCDHRTTDERTRYRILHEGVFWQDIVCRFRRFRNTRKESEAPRFNGFTWSLYSVQIENYIKESMKMEMAQLQQSAVHNHTAAMLEMGTNLLSRTAEQTRKLTDVETQVRKTSPLTLSNTCTADLRGWAAICRSMKRPWKGPGRLQSDSWGGFEGGNLCVETLNRLVL